jgi:hypothetical protein
MKASGISPTVRQHGILLEMRDSMGEMKEFMGRIEKTLTNGSTTIAAASTADIVTIQSTIRSTIHELRSSIQESLLMPTNNEQSEPTTNTEPVVVSNKFPRTTIDNIWYEWFKNEELNNYENKDDPAEVVYKSKAKQCIDFLVELLAAKGIEPPTSETSHEESMEIYKQARVELIQTIQFKKNNNGAPLSYNTLYNRIREYKKAHK